MEPRNDRPENLPPNDPGVARAILNDFENLRQNLIPQLTRDIARLQAEKHRLMDDIENIQTRARQLRSSPGTPSASEPTAEQQQWAQQMAGVLAARLQEQLSQQLGQISDNRALGANSTRSAWSPGSPGSTNNEQFLASLDNNLAQTVTGLNRELSNQQSSLSQQLVRIQNLQQQGEVLLEALVNRLSDQLQTEARATGDETQTGDAFRESDRLDGEIAQALLERGAESPSTGDRPNIVPPEVKPEPQPPTAPPQPSATKSPVSAFAGILFALAAAAVLSLFNVSVRVILSDAYQIFGVWDWGGIISPSFGNSILILFIRMIVVVLLMPILASQLYPAIWRDLRQFWRGGDRTLKRQVVGSGFSLFLSQIFIYMAIGRIATAVAITLFFVFPIITVLASWALFGDRPSTSRLGIMAIIFVGGIVAVPDFLSVFSSEGTATDSNLTAGILAALAAGVTFAGYILLTQMCTKKLHPIPFSLANFTTIFVLSLIGLLIAIPANFGVKVDPGQGTNLLWGGIWLGVLTLGSYLLNNFAIRNAGASLASIIGATGPVLTALFAFLIIQEQLGGPQIFGMVLVTLGVVALSLERMFQGRRNASAK